MSKRIHKAIFERFATPTDNFGAAKGEWQEVAKEWVSLEPQRVDIGKEFVNAAQTQSTSSSTAGCIWSPTMSRVDVSCRMKIEKNNVVNESEPNSDANFRIFQIENIVNVREMNRELQMMVVERA